MRSQGTLQPSYGGVQQAGRRDERPREWRVTPVQDEAGSATHGPRHIDSRRAVQGSLIRFPNAGNKSSPRDRQTDAEWHADRRDGLSSRAQARGGKHRDPRPDTPGRIGGQNGSGD